MENEASAAGNSASLGVPVRLPDIDGHRADPVTTNMKRGL